MKLLLVALTIFSSANTLADSITKSGKDLIFEGGRNGVTQDLFHQIELACAKSLRSYCNVNGDIIKTTSITAERMYQNTIPQYKVTFAYSALNNTVRSNGTDAIINGSLNGGLLAEVFIAAGCKAETLPIGYLVKLYTDGGIACSGNGREGKPFECTFPNTDIKP